MFDVSWRRSVYIENLNKKKFVYISENSENISTEEKGTAQKGKVLYRIISTEGKGIVQKEKVLYWKKKVLYSTEWTDVRYS